MPRALLALPFALLAGCFTPTGDPPRDASVHPARDAGLQCPACEPSCAGRACGDDGCGGSCGGCGAGMTCRVSQCFEDDSFCATRDCGPDGRGGECGTCPVGYGCSAEGYCLPVGGCAALPSGGACVSGNVERCEGGGLVRTTCPYGACQVDPASGSATCGPAPCMPNCFGRGCGSDGCGGSCGTCASDETCDQDLGVCTPPCSRIPAKGTCLGTVLVGCTDGRIEKTSCLAFDQICDATSCSSAACRPVGRAAACLGLTEVGTCHDQTLYVCSGGVLATQRCAEDGQRCARVALDSYACTE